MNYWQRTGAQMPPSVPVKPPRCLCVVGWVSPSVMKARSGGWAACVAQQSQAHLAPNHWATEALAGTPSATPYSDDCCQMMAGALAPAPPPQAVGSLRSQHPPSHPQVSSLGPALLRVLFHLRAADQLHRQTSLDQSLHLPTPLGSSSLQWETDSMWQVLAAQQPWPWGLLINTPQTTRSSTIWIAVSVL